MATCKWIATLALVSSLLLSGIASAQTIEDHPTYKGGNQRTGTNGDPLGSGPGMANLRWWTPNGANNLATTNLVVDNTDLAPFVYGANPLGIFGLSSLGANPANDWVNAPLPDQTVTNSDAADPFIEFDTNGNERVPTYFFTNGTPANAFGTPTVAANPANLRTAAWTFIPPSINPSLYALYVWIPIGPQVINGKSIFPQRYYVYQINAGGRTVTDVVDSYVSGGGWVRLGNGGLPTNKVYPWDGLNSVSITLFNTIPLNQTVSRRARPHRSCMRTLQWLFRRTAITIPVRYRLSC